MMTLLIITIFSLFFLFLSSQIITNGKHFQMTEDDLQATSLAEMGIYYQKTKILTVMDQFFSKENINDQFELFLQNIDLTDLDHEKINELFQDYLKEELRKQLNQNVTNHDETYLDSPKNTQFYKIINTGSKITDDEIIITFTSIGNNSEKERKINTNYRLPIANTKVSLEECQVSDDPTTCIPKQQGDTHPSMPNGQQIQEPQNLPACPNELSKFLNRGYCQINGNLVLESGNKSFIHSTIKITGTLNDNGDGNSSMKNVTNSLLWISGNMNTKNFNNADQVQIHVGGTTNFNQNVNNIKDSTIEIMGSATFSGNIQNMSETNIYIGGSASFNGQVDLENKNNVFVNGNTTVSKYLNVSSNSTFCVNGSLTVNGQVNGSNVYARSSNHSNVNTNADDFIVNCLGGMGDANEGLKAKVDIENTDWNDLLNPSFEYK